MTYLEPAQVAQLLRPINPSRVGQDGKGFSHVEAYEIRAHLNRIFGFARWSEEVVDQQLLYETSEPKKNKKNEDYTAWTVTYRSLVRLTIDSPSGDRLAVYTEGSTGSASNQPSRADAHDLALKTSQSQALKRAAANLGDQFGLSLYRKGSTVALVKGLVLPAEGAPAESEPVDAHITDTPPEDFTDGLIGEIRRLALMVNIDDPATDFAEWSQGLILDDADPTTLTSYRDWLDDQRRKGQREHKQLAAEVQGTTQAGRFRKGDPDAEKVQRSDGTPANDPFYADAIPDGATANG